jgi:pimeloyl-ACP methyl ester carboxylesterase
MRVVVNETAIFFDVRGRKIIASGATTIERPTIILLHGGPGMDHMVFEPAFARLSNSAQVIYLDHRACGRSDAGPVSSWHLDQWAADLAAFVELLEIKKPIVLGTSFGGLVAQRFAGTYPHLPGGLVLMSTAVLSLPAKTFDALERRGGLRAREAAEAFFSDTAQPGVLERYLEICLPLYNSRPLDFDALARVKMRPEVMVHFPHRVRRGHAAMYRERTQASGQAALMRGHLSEQEAPELIIDSIVDFFGWPDRDVNMSRGR